MGKGSNTTTTVQQVPPQVLANYQQAFNTATAAAAQPYAPYTGQIVADLSAGQNYAIQNYASPTQAYEANQPGIGAYVTANKDIGAGVNALGQSGLGLIASQNNLQTAGNTYDTAGNIIQSQPEYIYANSAIGGVQPYLEQSNAYTSGASPTIAAGLGTIAGAQPYVGQAANTFQTGLGTISGAQPMVGTAANTIAGASGNYGLSQQELLNSTAPIWGNTMQYSPQSINSFYSPYVNDVVNATEQQFNNQNAIQQQQVIGNAAAQGAWGGDRSAVAQGIVAGQQQAAEAPVIAGLENTGFTQAQQEFNAQQQAQLGALETTGWLTSQAGTGLAGLGTAQVGQGAAQLGAAQTQQGIGQAQAGVGAQQLGAAQTQQGIGQAQLSGAQAQLQQAQEAAQQASLQTGVGQAYTNLGAGVVGQGQALGNIGAGQVGIAGAEQGITGQQIAAAGQMGNLAGQQTNANNAQVNYATQLYNAELGAINAGMSTGALQQAEQQAQLNVPYQIYTAGQAYPFQTSQFLTSAAEGLNPGGGTSTTTAPAPSPISGVGGLLSGIAGIAGLLVPSDERVKEDIQQIGKASPEHGGGAIYSFRYKGDPTTHIGQMAQEVERKRPDAVQEIGGIKMVDYRAATEERHRAGGRIDPAHGEMPMAVPHGIKPSLGLGPRHKMRLAQGGEVLPSGIVGWRQGEQKFQTGGTPQSIIPGMVLPGMTGAMASPISPVLPSTKIPDLTVSIVPPPGQAGHAGFGPPPPPTVQPGSAASGTLAGIGAAMPALGSAVSMAKNWFNQGTSTFNNTGWMSNSAANAPFNNAAATGLYNDPATTTAPTPDIGLWARGGRTYDDGGATPDTMADALARDDQSQFTPDAISDTPSTVHATNKAELFAAPASSGIAGSPSNWETRHNNFGGMRIPGVNAGPNAGGFQSFDTPEQGVAAISHQLDRYASGATTGRPLTTLNDIVSTWAPPSENDTGALITRASKIMGVAPNQQLDLSDPGVKARLIEATIRNEMGGALPVDPKIISDVASGAIPYTGASPSRGISPRAPVQLASTDGAQVYAIPDAAPSSGIAGMPTGSKLVEQTAEGKPSGLDALRAKGVDPWLALAIAGFATAAGRSPFPMQNIGAGFLEGAKYIQQQTAAYPEQQLKRAEAQYYQAQIGYQPELGVDGLDKRITDVSKLINKEPSPKDTAQPLAPLPSAQGTTPMAQVAGSPTGGATAATPPAGGMTTLPNSGIPVPTAPGYDVYDNYYHNADAQIRDIMRGPGLPLQKREAVWRITQQMQQQVANDPRFTTQKLAAEELAKTNAAPQEYQVPGPNNTTITRVAPRSQVIAGTAPGMTPAAAAAAGPATEGGKYDPSPESVIPLQPPPGAIKFEHTAPQQDKLKADADELKTYREQASQTPITLQRTQQLSDIIHQLNTGPLAEHGYELFRYAHNIGLDSLIPDKYNPANIEEVNKLATSLVFEQLKAIGGRPMVNEIMGLQKANPSVALTPEANLSILANISAESKYTQDRYLNASKVFTKYGQLGDFDQRYVENSPVKAIYDSTRKVISGSESPPVPGAWKGADGQWRAMIGGNVHILKPPKAGEGAPPP